MAFTEAMRMQKDFTAVDVWKSLVCILAFAVLDWATFSPALAPLGVTPWNPAIGLAVAAVIISGPRLAPLLALAPFISDVFVRSLPFPWWVTAAEASLIGAGYWSGLWLLLRPRTKFDPSLRTLRDLLLLGAVLAAAAFVVAVAYNVVLMSLGYLPKAQLSSSIIRYWVGEIIGVMVMTPFLLLMAFRSGFPRLSLEILVQGIAVIIAVIIVVGLSERPQLQLSFLLLLPIVWLALRYGFEGVTAGLLLLQVCMMIALHARNDAQADVTLIQAVMVMLTVSGLAIGLLVSERSEDERRMRLLQDAMARAARLGSMGEFAGAMAHELNQPLTAAGNYARAAAAALKEGAPPRLADARNAAEKLVEQVDRSAQVIRRLRELIRVGRIETRPHRVGPLLTESLALLRPTLQSLPVHVEVALQAGLPRIAVDALQIQQVVTNLVRNAAEALVEAGTEAPRVILSARRATGDCVEIAVVDNGPGFPADFDVAANRAMASTKPDGLGIGLSLCRTIVEAHGGDLVVEQRIGGATVRFNVPIAQEDAHA